MQMMTMMSTLLMNGGEPPNNNAYHKPQIQNIGLTIGCLSMSKIIKASQPNHFALNNTHKLFNMRIHKRVCTSLI